MKIKTNQNRAYSKPFNSKPMTQIIIGILEFSNAGDYTLLMSKFKKHLGVIPIAFLFEVRCSFWLGHF